MNEEKNEDIEVNDIKKTADITKETAVLSSSEINETDKSNTEITEEAFIHKERVKPAKREFIQMILGAYAGMLPLLIVFVAMMLLMLLLLIVWGG